MGTEREGKKGWGKREGRKEELTEGRNQSHAVF